MGFRLRGLEVGLLQRLDCLCTGILEPVGEKTEDSKTSYSKKLGDQYGRKKKRMSSHTKGTLLPVVQPRVQAEKGAVDHKTGAVTKKMHVLGVYHVSVNIPIATGHAELQSTIKAQNAERRSPTLQS